MNTDSAGFFRSPDASVGSYRLIAERDGFAPSELTLTVSEGADQEDLEFLLTPTEGVRVYVTLASGVPAKQFFAGFADSSGTPLSSGLHAAGEDGSARLSIGTGAWELQVATTDSAVWSSRITAPSEPIFVTLEPQALLRVHVPELEDTSTLADVRITGADGRAFRSLQWMRSRDSWPLMRGRADIEGLSAGSWTVRVEAPDGRVWQEQVTLAVGENPELVLR